MIENMMLDKIQIDVNSKKPKYRQLADSISNYIANEETAIQERMPSVKQFSKKLELSRETVFKALNILSEKGIIVSSDRRGYFIAKTDVDIDVRVFLMLDKMTAFKEKIYDGLRNDLKENSEVDVFFHHGNTKIFVSLLQQNLTAYTHFVVTTFFDEDVSDILNSIPDRKLIILDRIETSIENQHSQVFQDFENDIYDSLSEVSEKIKKYEVLSLVAPATAPHRLPVIKGFERFCAEFKFKGTIIDHNEISEISSGSLYILIGSKDDDLVKIIKYCRKNNFQLGTEIGVISYNDTQMKEILEGGITVISTDFEHMGKRAAEIIKMKEMTIERNPSKIIVRTSL